MCFVLRRVEGDTSAPQELRSVNRHEGSLPSGLVLVAVIMTFVVFFFSEYISPRKGL